METNGDFKTISSKLRILLADDDKDDCLLFKEALDELPVTVELTIKSNGELLMEHLTEKGCILPDVLFLDLNMPLKNGFAALGEIKRNSSLDKLPVIIFTTSDDKEMVKKVFRDAAHYFIHKPSNFSDLKDVIYRVLTLVSEETIVLPMKEHFILTGRSNLSPK